MNNIMGLVNYYYTYQLLVWCFYTIHTDIDECSENNGDCQQNCTNFEGSFVCQCYAGYSSDDNGTTCSGK